MTPNPFEPENHKADTDVDLDTARTYDDRIRRQGSGNRG